MIANIATNGANWMNMSLAQRRGAAGLGEGGRDQHGEEDSGDATAARSSRGRKEGVRIYNPALAKATLRAWAKGHERPARPPTLFVSPRNRPCSAAPRACITAPARRQRIGRVKAMNKPGRIYRNVRARVLRLRGGGHRRHGDRPDRDQPARHRERIRLRHRRDGLRHRAGFRLPRQSGGQLRRLRRRPDERQRNGHATGSRRCSARSSAPPCSI